MKRNNLLHIIFIVHFFLLGFVTNVKAQDFVSELKKCIDKVDNSSAFNLVVKVEVIQTSNQKVLDKSEMVYAKTQAGLYSKVLDVESFFSFDSQLSFSIDHDRKKAWVSSKPKNEINSLGDHFKTIFESIKTNRSMFSFSEKILSNATVYSMYFNKEHYADYTIDTNDNQIIEVVVHHNEPVLQNGQKVETMLKMNYDYASKFNSPEVQSNFKQEDGLWKLGSKLSKNYQFIDVRTKI